MKVAGPGCTVIAPRARATSCTPSNRIRSCAPGDTGPTSTSAELGFSNTNASAGVSSIIARSIGFKPVPLTLYLAMITPPTPRRRSCLEISAGVTESMRGVAGRNSR